MDVTKDIKLAHSLYMVQSGAFRRGKVPKVIPSEAVERTADPANWGATVRTGAPPRGVDPGYPRDIEAIKEARASDRESGAPPASAVPTEGPPPQRPEAWAAAAWAAPDPLLAEIEAEVARRWGMEPLPPLRVAPDPEATEESKSPVLMVARDREEPEAEAAGEAKRTGREAADGAGAILRALRATTTDDVTLALVDALEALLERTG